jgi:hypothetical protein
MLTSKKKKAVENQPAGWLAGWPKTVVVVWLVGDGPRRRGCCDGWWAARICDVNGLGGRADYITPPGRGRVSFFPETEGSVLAAGALGVLGPPGTDKGSRFIGCLGEGGF